ncbi:Fur family transcriptional regulator [Microbacterium sp. P05]|uniref:Fur family transcriptional regulator n=1 Tax=Microbacterium sp. P05 TaxID=3366948 RepID=UPI00374651D0
MAPPETASGSADADMREMLRARGLRVTTPRLAVLDAIRVAPHSEATRIAELVRGGGLTVSTQAVYDVLHACTSAGLLRAVEPAGSPARYELRVGDNHHHLVCRSCGAVTDVECTHGAAPCLQPGDAAGFVIDEAEITFWGLCPECQRLDAASPIPPETDTRERDIP